MMSKIAIRENNVLAVETRSGLFAIAQALKDKTLVFFNLFTTTPLSLNADLDSTKFLCCVTPTKDFFQKSNIIKLGIKPAIDITYYREQDRLAFQFGPAQRVVVYEGTKDECSILVLGKKLRLVNWKYETIKNLDKKQDQKIICSYPLLTTGVYGELNERLYLSYRFGKYVEPTKDVLMGNKLPLEYKTYLRMQAVSADQRIGETEWLSLPIENVLY